MNIYDIIITGNSEEQINTLKKCLASEFAIKDLGLLSSFF